MHEDNLSGSTLLTRRWHARPRPRPHIPRPHTSKAKAKAAEFGLKGTLRRRIAYIFFGPPGKYIL